MEIALVLIPALAVLAPLLSRALAPVLKVPVVVFELLLGILVGPSVFGWVQATELLDSLSEFGLAILFFLAGSEIDFRRIQGRPLKRSTLGWLVSLALGLAIGLAIAPGEGAVIIAIALSSTALGTILPILRDAGELGSPFGRAATALGAVGEFGPLIAISVFLGARQIGAATVVLLAFVLIAGAAIILALRVPAGRLHAVVNATLHTSAQFAIRVVFAILAALVVLSMVLDLDMLLGAFAAGVIWRLMMRNAPETDRSAVESKIEAVAFGLFVPIFFIMTGVSFDLQALLADPVSLALVPVLLVLLLVTRGLPAQWAVPVGTGRRDRVALGLLAATGLPIIVAVTSIGVNEKLIDSATAAALVGAGMLSVLVYPLVAMSLQGRHVSVEAIEDDG